MGMIERGEASAEELHGAYLDAIAARDGEIHAYLKVVEECEGSGVPIAIKDVITTEGIETTAGSKDPRRLRARVRLDRGGEAQAGRSARAR